MTRTELTDRIVKGEREQCMELNLSGMQMLTLPAEIGRLTNLHMLDLTDNGLTALPWTLGRLLNLHVLSLSNNRLTALPPEIGRLGHLTRLNLWRNQLNVFPVEIAALPRLHSLYLGHNLLRTLPADIGRITNLSHLDLSNNQLVSLPAEIGNLSNLTELDLSRNALTSLPPEIGRLANLTKLDLRGNQLATLPAEICQLGELTELHLDGNPLHSPPAEVISQGTRAVLTYLRAQRSQGMRRLWYSKMVLVGEGGVGKTSLLRVLQGKPFNEQEPSTLGLDAYMQAHEAIELPYPRPIAPGGRGARGEGNIKMRLYIWDFGGQQIYHATHQFFLTDKSLFVLVWNGRLGYEQCRLEYWLDMLKTRAPTSPILIVATHQDQRPAEALPIKEWQNKYNIVFEHEVSNKTGQGIEELKTRLAEVAAELPLMGQEYPQNWVNAIETVQNTYMQYRRDPDKARNYFHISELLSLLDMQHHMEEDEAHVMLQWFHNLGGLLHYPDDPELCDVAILNPWWASRIINRVLDHDEQWHG